MQTGYDRSALVARLEALADERYRAFNEGLIPGAENASIGVRMPALRAVSRELLAGDWRAFLEASRDDPLHEIRMLHAMVLGGAKCSVEEKRRLVDAFLPFVNNWAVCDALCAGMKLKAAERDALFPFVLACADSPVEFRKRFGLVMLMSHYREDRYASAVIAAFRRFSHEGYYARMGAAWGLATLFLTRREAVLDILRGGALDVFTHNITIRKLCESSRVPDGDKQLARTLRRRAGGRS